ncbi:MAG: hypothetical protein KBA06_00565 [Saprospiraceae bacterium]|nr:hypothetical protein [Saprospiraceae bacterium]
MNLKKQIITLFISLSFKSLGFAQQPNSPFSSQRQYPFEEYNCLKAVLKGEVDSLLKCTDSRNIKFLQKKLLELGYSLPKTRESGKWDLATKNAISRYKKYNNITDANDQTLLSFIENELSNKDTSVDFRYEYDKLLSDNQLNITIAIGFEEDLLYLQLIQSMKSWLLSHQFAPKTIAGVKETYYSKRSINKSDSLIDVWITFISPGKGAASEFINKLKEDEIILYLGHARGGIGPDFDHKNNPSEQIVFGKNSNLHPPTANKLQLPSDNYYKTVTCPSKNDLEILLRNDASWSQEYRVWFFNACNTFYYLDEFRNGLLPSNINSKNLDLLLSDDLTPIEGYFDTSIIFLEALFNGAGLTKTINAINISNSQTINKLKKIYPDKAKIFEVRKNQYFFDGIFDNPKLGDIKLEKSE